MSKKIFQSIFTVALVVLLASIGIATSFLYDYFNKAQVNQLKAELSLVADTVNEVGVEYFEKYGKEEAAKRIYATTDKARGTLKNLSDKEGYETFVIPDELCNGTDIVKVTFRLTVDGLINSTIWQLYPLSIVKQILDQEGI